MARGTVDTVHSTILRINPRRALNLATLMHQRCLTLIPEPVGSLEASLVKHHLGAALKVVICLNYRFPQRSLAWNKTQSACSETPGRARGFAERPLCYRRSISHALPTPLPD
jgi:hypothetical protein